MSHCCRWALYLQIFYGYSWNFGNMISICYWIQEILFFGKPLISCVIVANTTFTCTCDRSNTVESIFAKARLGFHFTFIFLSFWVSTLRKNGNKMEWKMIEKWLKNGLKMPTVNDPNEIKNITNKNFQPGIFQWVPWGWNRELHTKHRNFYSPKCWELVAAKNEIKNVGNLKKQLGTNFQYLEIGDFSIPNAVNR